LIKSAKKELAFFPSGVGYTTETHMDDVAMGREYFYRYPWITGCSRNIAYDVREENIDLMLLVEWITRRKNKIRVFLNVSHRSRFEWPKKFDFI
jgi:hypothetical protein